MCGVTLVGGLQIQTLLSTDTGNDFGTDAPLWRFSLLFTAVLYSTLPQTPGPGTQSMPFLFPILLHEAVPALLLPRGMGTWDGCRKCPSRNSSPVRSMCVIASLVLSLEWKCGLEGKKLIFSGWMFSLFRTKGVFAVDTHSLPASPP